jgi:hypothetical protein
MFSEELLDCVVSLEEEELSLRIVEEDEAISMALEEELSMALEDKLSLQIVEEDEAISTALEEELSMTLEDKLSLRIVEDDEAISTALEEDNSSISVSLAEALSSPQATNIADKAKVPTKSFVSFMEPSIKSIYRITLTKKVRQAKTPNRAWRGLGNLVLYATN